MTISTQNPLVPNSLINTTPETIDYADKHFLSQHLPILDRNYLFITKEIATLHLAPSTVSKDAQLALAKGFLFSIMKHLSDFLKLRAAAGKTVPAEIRDRCLFYMGEISQNGWMDPEKNLNSATDYYVKLLNIASKTSYFYSAAQNGLIIMAEKDKFPLALQKLREFKHLVCISHTILHKVPSPLAEITSQIDEDSIYVTRPGLSERQDQLTQCANLPKELEKGRVAVVDLVNVNEPYPIEKNGLRKRKLHPSFFQNSQQIITSEKSASGQVGRPPKYCSLNTRTKNLYQLMHHNNRKMAVNYRLLA